MIYDNMYIQEVFYLEKIYSVKEAAEYLGLCTATIIKMIKNGKLKALQFEQNGKWKIKESELLKKIQQGGVA